MSVSEQLSFEEDERFETLEEQLAREKVEADERRRKYRREHKLNPRKKFLAVPIPGGQRFCIAPEIAPIFEELAVRAARDIEQEEIRGVASKGLTGIGILAARSAVTMKKNPDSVVRRIYEVVNRRQLFINATFVECVLMSMDAEHEFTYGEWPSTRADALEIVADFGEGRFGPDKLMRKANRLYEKGVRKALKHAVELNI